jgi:hypothetical protein
MGYYEGDYYAGAQGDPFWGALLGIGKKLGGMLLGGVRGGGGRTASTGTLATLAEKGGAIVRAGKGMIIKHPVLSAAGAAGALGALGGAGARSMMGPGGQMRGFHHCKSKHGCKSGEWVRNRHMNPCNPRALRRAIRRATRFTHLAMKTIHLVHPKKKGRFGGFKKRRRAA